ncbi:hypothetical protein IFR05_013534 [Cadophora sp. M221]|nr:hypothetical protein IFR05_013534 [Cadophora sp. M221]
MGIDFGTTNTSVSFVVHGINERNPRVSSKEVKHIINWPQDGNAGARAQVPTELWYSPAPILRDTSTDHSQTSNSEEETEDDDQPRRGQSEGHQQLPFSPFEAYRDSFHHAIGSNKYKGWSPINEEATEHLWGYQVQYQKYRSSTDRDIMGHIDRPKLLLVGTEWTHGDRKRLRPRLKYLIKRGIIRKYGDLNAMEPGDLKDVLVDYFVEILGHSKQQLIEREGYTPECPVTFSLTVPSFWSAHSSRMLQSAVQAAIKATDFGNLVHGSVENVFIVSEPEAAATFLLDNTHTMLYCIFTVTNSYPLRLYTEVGQLNGDNCGASYLNDAFEKRLLKRLEDEHYLDSNGETREDIVRYATLEFEHRDKRLVDIARRPVGEVKIPGLLGDDQRRLRGLEPKNFKPGYVLLNRDDYDEMFMPCLQRIAAVLQKQIDGALQLGINIKKVFLIGGFGAAPSLRSFLRKYLLELARKRMLNYDIELLFTNEQDSITAIASGATIRALSLEHGPKRKAVSSFGFPRTEPYQPEAATGHREADIKIDSFDGCSYASVIDYFLHKKSYPPYVGIGPSGAHKLLTSPRKKFICREILFVNDSDKTKSSYNVNHVINAGAEKAGRLVVDMTYLRDEGHISPTIPEPNEYGVVLGRPHYRVTYDLVPVVEGRDLKYVAMYPASDNGEVMKAGQISIAAAFNPGTG